MTQVLKYKLAYKLALGGAFSSSYMGIFRIRFAVSHALILEDRFHCWFQSLSNKCTTQLEKGFVAFVTTAAHIGCLIITINLEWEM